MERARREERTREEPQRPAAQHRAPMPARDVLAMQRTVGNALVARAMAARQPETAGATTEGAPGAGLGRPHVERGMRDSADVELLQLKLNWHLGPLRKRLLLVDGWFGGKTAQALRDVKRANRVRPANAVVDDATWEMLDREPVAAQPTGGAASGRSPEYDRMVEDGLIDVTLGIGFDEHGLLGPEFEQTRRGLVDVRHFQPDAELATRLRREAGRPAASGEGELLVKENIGRNAERAVHCVIRLITPQGSGGTGAGARAAAVQGMEQSDAFLYSGHARHGTGPDFDRNYSFVIHWDAHPSPPPGKTGDEPVEDSRQLVALLGLRGTEDQKIARFEELRTATPPVVTLVAHSGGNIGINAAPRAHHARTLSAHFMTLAAAGQERPLEGQIRERRYRLWLFNGCTTSDYVDTIRAGAAANPSLGSRDLDMSVTTQPGWVASVAETALAYLDGILARETAAGLEQRLELAQPRELGAVDYENRGFEDNPR